MIKRLLAELKISFNVGQSYAYDFRYPVLLAIALKVWFPTATLLELGLITVGIIVIFVVLGWFDLRFIRFHQTVAEIQTHKYNPFFEKLKGEKFK